MVKVLFRGWGCFCEVTNVNILREHPQLPNEDLDVYNYMFEIYKFIFSDSPLYLPSSPTPSCSRFLTYKQTPNCFQEWPVTRGKNLPTDWQRDLPFPILKLSALYDRNEKLNLNFQSHSYGKSGFN